MLALRLGRRSGAAVQLRRLMVVAASGGTGFLLLSALAHALAHPEAPGDASVRLAWCAAPLAATVYLAVAVARTDPGTRPRPGLSAIGLGPGRLMAVSAVTTALSCLLGSALGLLFFLHLRGDLTGMPFDGGAAALLSAGPPLPLPATLTLLALVPLIASVATVLALRPREAGGLRGAARRRTAGARRRDPGASPGSPGSPPAPAPASSPSPASVLDGEAAATGGVAAVAVADEDPDDDGPAPVRVAGVQAPLTAAPDGLPWGVAILVAGLGVATYANRTGVALSADLSTVPGGLLAGWALAALGLALIGPGLTHLCGRLLQAARPGAVRLLAGRVLMAEASRIGRPLGVVAAVAALAYALILRYGLGGPVLGPLGVLGAVLVAGCTAATLAAAAIEVRQLRADTMLALLRVGAPATTLRACAALRAGVLLAVYGPLTVAVAELASLTPGS
ncbi:hypothetical protein [Streptomyces fragilis]|uniref:Integral membrane protein n=1 Tax=Streptomyces fragilis TaxID=67301 RepID=A0ABV2YHQ5_9ACTN|nr:hypothetical protein [Streptomyces fragilis]